MDIEKLTVRVQKSLNEAYNEAVKHHNQQVDVIHLFSALVNQEDGLIPNIFEKMNVSVTAMKNSIEEELNKMPQIYGEGISSQGEPGPCVPGHCDVWERWFYGHSAGGGVRRACPRLGGPHSGPGRKHRRCDP